MTEPRANQDGLIFIHVMKTGGTSLTDRIREEFAPGAAYPTETDPPRAKVLQKMSVEDFVALKDERRRYRYFSVHMPADVRSLVPDYFSVTVLREPVERTLSHLRQLRRVVPEGPASLDELYESHGIQAALSNYQTRVFATEIDSVPDRPDQDDLTIDFAKLANDPRVAVLLGISLIPELSSSDVLSAAQQRLERFDVVGTTDSLANTQRQIENRFGWENKTVRRSQVGKRAGDVSGSLLRRIEADNQLDSELYEIARERSLN